MTAKSKKSKKYHTYLFDFFVVTYISLYLI
jgi:hypothetical protein